ncbi:MAG: carboxymuconolactone decarboxylase family protein [Phycisphaerales bacterium]|nr:carboxymuconolactone decarboxylase family protein [Phycisphaerales bacterium]
MPRIHPIAIKNAPEGNRPILENIQSGLGRVPNLLATFGHSTAALNSYVMQKEALAKGSLGAQFGESIAIAMASFTGCGYCASAHEAIGKGAGLSDEERVLNRKGEASDPKVQAGINMAKSIVETRGWSNDEAFAAAKAAGLSDAEVLEVLAIAMFNLYTNYANHFLETENDFPAVELDEAMAV